MESNLSIDASVILEIKIGASGLAVALIYVRNIAGARNCCFYTVGMRTAIGEDIPFRSSYFGEHRLQNRKSSVET